MQTFSPIYYFFFKLVFFSNWFKSLVIKDFISLKDKEMPFQSIKGSLKKNIVFVLFLNELSMFSLCQNKFLAHTISHFLDYVIAACSYSWRMGPSLELSVLGMLRAIVVCHNNAKPQAKKVRHTYLRKDLRDQQETFRKQTLTSLVLCSTTAKKGQVKVVSWHCQLYRLEICKYICVS